MHSRHFIVRSEAIIVTSFRVILGIDFGTSETPMGTTAILCAESSEYTYGSTLR